MDIINKLRFLRSTFKHRRLFVKVIESYLIFLKDPEKKFWGSLTEKDQEGIRRAVSLAESFGGPIVEIGALFGHTTNLIASLKHMDVPLIAVDNFTWNPFWLPPETHREFTRRTLRYVLDHCNTSLHDGDSAEFYASWTGPRPRMVFIDAGHDYGAVRADITWAVSKGVPVISGHDFAPGYPGLIKAVEESFGSDVEIYGSVWIARNSEALL